mmetsp:Transcript_54850/g.169066  ORF Transcript_54850/g.169066 Transcript_54850/m.169066 type:complete len:439 (+) Transcript_54850:2243-3559(+)
MLARRGLRRGLLGCGLFPRRDALQLIEGLLSRGLQRRLSRSLRGLGLLLGFALRLLLRLGLLLRRRRFSTGFAAGRRRLHVGRRRVVGVVRIVGRVGRHGDGERDGGVGVEAEHDADAVAWLQLAGVRHRAQAVALHQLGEREALRGARHVRQGEGRGDRVVHGARGEGHRAGGEAQRRGPHGAADGDRERLAVLGQDRHLLPEGVRRGEPRGRGLRRVHAEVELVLLARGELHIGRSRLDADVRRHLDQADVAEQAGVVVQRDGALDHFGRGEAREVDRVGLDAQAARAQPRAQRHVERHRLAEDTNAHGDLKLFVGADGGADSAGRASRGDRGRRSDGADTGGAAAAINVTVFRARVRRARRHVARTDFGRARGGRGVRGVAESTATAGDGRRGVACAEVVRRGGELIDVRRGRLPFATSVVVGAAREAAFARGSL